MRAVEIERKDQMCYFNGGRIEKMLFFVWLNVRDKGTDRKLLESMVLGGKLSDRIKEYCETGLWCGERKSYQE